MEVTFAAFQIDANLDGFWKTPQLIKVSNVSQKCSELSNLKTDHHTTVQFLRGFGGNLRLSLKKSRTKCQLIFYTVKWLDFTK